MSAFYLVLKTLIESGTRPLRDIEARINLGLANGQLSPDEYAELLNMATNAPEVPDLPEQSDIAVRLGMVEARLAVLGQTVERLTAGSEPEEDNGAESAPAAPPPGAIVWAAGQSHAFGATVWHTPTENLWVSKVGNNKIEPGKADYAWARVG